MTKVVGKASNSIKIDSIHKFINKSLETLKEEEYKEESE